MPNLPTAAAMLEPRLNDSARDRITRRFFVREGTSDAELAVGVTRRCAWHRRALAFLPWVPPNARQAREASAFRTQGEPRAARGAAFRDFALRRGRVATEPEILPRCRLLGLATPSPRPARRPRL